MFFLFERYKLDGLKALLPVAASATVTLEDESSNKLLLVSARL